MRHALAVNADPLRDTSGRINGAIAVARDITAQRQLDQMRDEFINTASHELRAPLTPIILAARVMQRHVARLGDDAKLQHLAEELVRYATCMSRLVDTMLDMARISHDRFSLTQQPCDLALTIRQTCNEQAVSAQRTIIMSGLDQPLPALADPDRIAQALANVLANAARYSPPGTTIQADAAREVGADAAWLHLRIIDQGAGMAPETLSQVFERFYRGEDMGGAAGQPGLGLGLYIARAIVERHGGRIWAESAYGQGSTFHLLLPLRVPL
jgi:signal transduction histidine kinase